MRFHWRQLEIAFQCLEEIQKEPVGSFYMRGTGFEPAQALSYRISLPDFFIEKVQHLSPARLTTPTPPHCRAVLDEPKHIGDIRHPHNSSKISWLIKFVILMKCPLPCSEIDIRQNKKTLS